MKKVNSIGLINDERVGMMIAVTYSEVDDEGQVISPNHRMSYAPMEPEVRERVSTLFVDVQNHLDQVEE